MSAHRLGARAVIVMPVTTPQVKIDAVKALGGEVVLHGDSYSDAYLHAVELEKKQGLTFVHPFDDPDVIAGQGTIAMEILRQHQGPLDAVFVAIGGGGLISGVANYIKAVRPEIKVIGVQMNDSDAMMQLGRREQARHAGRRRPVLRRHGGEAGGRGNLPRRARAGRRVHDGRHRRGLRRDQGRVHRHAQHRRAGRRARGGGDQAVRRRANKTRGETYAAILCGANMNFDRLRFVAERAEVGEEREALFAVTIPEERGSFRRFCEVIGTLPGGPRNVTEFNYRISDAAQAHVFVGLTTHGKGESVRIAANFSRHGFEALDLTHDELAKEHIRHMVGGRSALAHDERLLRFVFPERPGALMKFLSHMRPELEHHALPLSQPGRRLRPHPGRAAGAQERRQGFQGLPRHIGLPFCRGNRQPGLPIVPSSLTTMGG